MQAGPSEILVLSDLGNPVWLAADLIAQAEHDPDARAILVTSKAPLAAAVAREVVRQMPASGPAREALARHGGIIVTRTRAEAVALANRMAPEHLVVDDEATAATVTRAGAIFIGQHTAQVAGDYAIGSNHVLPTGGAARLRGGLHAADFVRVVSVQRVTAAGLKSAGTHRARAGAGRGADRARAVHDCEGRVSQAYQHPVTAAGALRLHLNENTAGCSPKVLEALRALGRDDLALYPDYDAVYREAAQYIGVPESSLLLTNGLDEGILLAAVIAQKRRPADGDAESIVILPAFDMYAISVEAVGGRVVSVSPTADFTFPLEATLAAITPRTRVVFITSPNNPTGVRVSNDAIRAVARSLPPEALVFVDEAYHDFCGDTIVHELGSLPNVVVGRTFAKAQGLAALRAGALVAVPETLDAFKPVIPPYSLNVAAAAALRAALADRDYLAWYVGPGARLARALLRVLPEARLRVLGEQRELRAGPRRRSRHGVDRRASQQGHLHSGQVGRSELPRLHPGDDRNRRGH